MLGSAHDGERLNALGMLQRMADTYRVPIHELLLTEETDGTGSDFNRQRAERAEQEARDANLRAQRAEQAARENRARSTTPDPPMPELPAGWRELFAKAQQLNSSRSSLSAWEATFVGDLVERGTFFPSPKQAVVIVRILKKIGLNALTPDVEAEDWEDPS
jgi:hypothetical protein